MRMWKLTPAVLALVCTTVRADPPAKPAEPVADPAATKLLAEARASRLLWRDFPGFTADVEVNIDGKISRGQVRVDASGKVTYAKLDAAAEAWARPTFNSIISHRFDAGSSDSECAFADKDETHPLGRAVRPLGDGMHSVFRVRDKQIMLVERRVKDRKFTISVLENRVNADGKYLPTSFVVDHWDLVTGELVLSEGNLQTWKRVGGFDLPLTAKAVASAKGTVKAHKIGDLGPASHSVKLLTLSNHQLLKPDGK